MEYRVIIVAAGCLLVGLLYAEYTRRSGLILSFKTPLSALFVVTALIAPHPAPTYFTLILAGLILGLIGDVCLALTGKRAFMAGLVAFLLGHVMYILAFAHLVKPSQWLTIAVPVIAVIAALIFLWLRAHVGSMLIPVVAYILVISVMMIGASAVWSAPLIAKAGAWIIWAGSLCFYISDVFVARDRFIRDEFLNRLIGLPLYYAGQFMLAFSVMLVK